MGKRKRRVSRQSKENANTDGSFCHQSSGKSSPKNTHFCAGSSQSDFPNAGNNVHKRQFIKSWKELNSPSALCVADGRKEVFRSWLSLTREEKLKILDVDSMELALRAAGAHNRYATAEDIQFAGKTMRSVTDTLLDECTAMTHLRVLFVEMVNGGQQKIPQVEQSTLGPIAIAVLHIFNEHLLRSYSQRVLVTQLTLFALFHVFVCAVTMSWTLWSVLGLIIVVFSITICITMAQSSVQTIMTVVFDDESSSNKIERKFSCFVCAFHLIQLSFWIPARPLLVVIATLPLLLIQFDTYTVARLQIDANGINFACIITSFCIEIALMYFSWFSSIQFFFFCCFFFPVSTRCVTGIAIIFVSFICSKLATPWGRVISVATAILLCVRLTLPTCIFALICIIVTASFLIPEYFLGAAGQILMGIVPFITEVINIEVVVYFVINSIVILMALFVASISVLKRFIPTKLR